MKVDKTEGRRPSRIGIGVWGCRGPPAGYRTRGPLGVQGAKPPEAKWIWLIHFDKKCLSLEKCSLTSLKEYKAIYSCGTFCFLKTLLRLLGLIVIYFGKNRPSQFFSFTNQFIFVFANTCQELIRTDRGCTALSTGICKTILTVTSVRVDQICIFQECLFNRTKTEIKEI